MKKTWCIIRGTSRANVCAAEINDAITRAAEIGFTDYDSIVLLTDHSKDEAHAIDLAKKRGALSEP